MSERANILFLLIDCLRSDALYASSKTSVTPNLNGIVENGFNCSLTISSSVTTTPCVAAILTGYYSFIHGIKTHMGYRLNPACKTMPEILGESGYRSYAEVTGPLDIKNGLDRGFESYKYRAVNDTFIGEWGNGFLSKLSSGYLAEPWFLFLHLWELHYPRRILRPFRSKRYGATPYDQALSSLDWQLGRLLEILSENTIVIIHGDHGEDIGRSVVDEKLRVLKRNAFYLVKRAISVKSPQLRHKINTYYNIGHGYSLKEDLIRVPLTFFNRAIYPCYTLEKSITRQIDILPTLLESLGIGKDPSISGESVLDRRQDKGSEDRAAYIEACGIALPKKEDWLEGVRTKRFKLITSPFNPKIPDELYDLEVDPTECENIASRCRDKREALQRELDRIKSMQGSVDASIEMTDEERRDIAKRLRRLGYF